MNLQTELHDLTAGQPAQPADRLSAVTNRAHRIRRTRALASVAAVLAIAAPVGFALQPQHHARTQFAGATTWPDRSVAAYRTVGTGALAAWENDRAGIASGKVHWLYRGLVSRPGRDDFYVAAWRTLSTVVLATAETRAVDESGFLRNKPGKVGGWEFFQSEADKVPAVIGLYVGTVQNNISENSLFALAAPQTRQLHWTSSGLPFSTLEGGGPTDLSGDLTSSNGVFLGAAGALAGPVTVDAPGNSPQPFGFGVQQLSLALPPPPEVPSTWILDLGGGGSTNPTTFTGVNYTTVPNPSASSTVTAVRCYGGGTLRLSVGKQPVGNAPCDGQTYRYTGAPDQASALLAVVGDRLQSYRFLRGHVLKS